jgi:hypothetical protein
MNNTYRSQYDFTKPIPRERFTELLNAACIVKAHRYCRQAALVWLATYPGDLLVNLYLAKAFAGDGKPGQALPLLQKICLIDPEFFEAQQELSSLQRSTNHQTKNNASSHSHGEGGTDINLPQEWKRHIAASKQALVSKDFDTAEESVHKALVSNPDSPLPAIQHIRIAHDRDNRQTIETLAQVYHQRWPECLHFSLYLADAYIQNGNETSGVALIHQCAARDAAGQVANRLWGASFPYKPLWPTDMAVSCDLPIPANLAAYMGWNQLIPGDNGSASNNIQSNTMGQAQVASNQGANTKPASQPTTTNAGKSSDHAGSANQSAEPSAEMLSKIHQEFERIAKQIKKPGYGRADGRFPIYVIFSSRRGLEEQYGPQTTTVLISHMKELVAEMRRNQGWGSTLWLPDDPDCTTGFGMKPVLATDPWKLKLSLIDLDHALAKKGSMIGALLIVGGPKVVPFHHLPNPTFDADAEVPSDNPYATLDDNYFIPEWPVGRLPGGAGPDVGLLLEQLRRTIAYHANENGSHQKFFPSFISKIRLAFKTLMKGPRRMRFCYGYTAHIWRSSSSAVYRTIGKPGSLLSSPPLESGNLIKKIKPAHLGYFNLHGIKDGVGWYGQKSTDSSTRWPDYPVALDPQDLNEDRTPKVVFSEACYGTYIDSKTIDQAMSLSFLSKGCYAVVGSTVVSYGSVTRPLIAADLLGYYFWTFLRQGLPVGAALLNAKFSLAREMSKRQGFLDGEDQKTLLSFVLFGDPLVTLKGAKATPKTIFRSVVHPSVKTYSDQAEDSPSGETIPTEVLVQVKQIVDRYLPELSEADITMSQQKCKCTFKNQQCTTCRYKTKNAETDANRMVVTLSKHVQVADKIHNHYARFTLDSNGTVLKLSASR